jgi:hypothetical protein
MADQLGAILRWHLAELERKGASAPADRKMALRNFGINVEAMIVEAAKTSDPIRRFELRAEECRVMGDCCSDKDARTSFESLARSYQKLADDLSREKS